MLISPPRNLESFKKQAKALKKRAGVTLPEANDKLAQMCGFKSYKEIRQTHFHNKSNFDPHVTP